MSKNVTWVPVSRKSPCPICGHSDWCSYSSDGKYTICRRVNNGNAKTKKDKNGSEFYFYYNELETLINLKSKPKPKATASINAPLPQNETLNRVYKALLEELSLSSNHHSKLKERGFEDQEICENAYKTLPFEGREEIALRLCKKFPKELLLKIPGFYQNANNNLSTSGPPGILIPIRNIKNEIIALKIRSDKKMGDNRYFYFSSKKHGGLGPGAHIHCPIPVRNTYSQIRITEGEFKADLATRRNDIYTISIPGVSNQNEVIPLLKSLSVSSVQIAFDQDWKTNPTVKKALTSLFLKLKNANIQPRIETWN